ncbi:MAG: phytanoyl-CoA dioxygenase family protein [Myxococcota bacterium]
MSDFYGVLPQTELGSELDRHLEELSVLGFTVIEDVIPEPDLVDLRTRLDAIYVQQQEEVEPEFTLPDVQEENQVRAPLCYDDRFVDMARHERILQVIQASLGRYFLIQLQIGIINAPDTENRQSVWHRDLLYQDYTSSKPLSVSAMICLDDFNEETGGTKIVPHSHRLERMPSWEFIEKTAVTPNAKAGSVTIMDSMAIHMAGFNSSGAIRRGLNTIYCCGLFKQQVSLPTQLAGKYADDPQLNVLLGYDAQPSESVYAWRKRRHDRSRKSGG